MSLSGYFEQHEEQAFIAKALAAAVAIIFLRNFLCGLIPFLLLIFPVVFLIGIRMEAAARGVEANELLKEHITFLPVMQTEKERRLEVKPWVTYTLIFVNVVIFYFFQTNVSQTFITDNLIFLPRRPDAFNVPLSAFTAMFLHGSGAHLWGNMTFLWVVGTAVERRVGELKFLMLYLLTGLIGGLVYITVEFLAHGEAGHALGASGAIAGIMGIFAVRCYFKTMIFPLPILGIFSLILPISLKIRLNSLIVMSLFFLADLSGGIGQITGTANDMIGHWAHLGGMISGMLIAGFLRLGDAAVEERHLDIGIKAAGDSIGFGGGEHSLRKVLERSPDNVEALLGLARLKTKFTHGEEGKELYERVLGSVAAAPGAADAEVVEVFREYRAKYLTVPSDPLLVSRLAEALRKAGEHEFSIFCLERLVAMPDATQQLREKALFQLATLLQYTGSFEAAQSCFARFANDFPHSILADKAKDKAGAAYAETSVPPSPAPAVGRPQPAEALENRVFPLQRRPESYRLVFDGNIPFTSDPEETKENLARLLRCGREKIDGLVCGRKTILKRGLERSQALKLKELFDGTGACCTVEVEERAAAVALKASVAPQAMDSTEPAPEPSFHCPKCGHPQAKGDYCVKCGVYFAKLAMLAERGLPRYDEKSDVAGTSALAPAG